MDYNQIPKTGTIGGMVDNITANFQLTKEMLERIQLSKDNSRGLFTTAAALQTAYPSPEVGDWAIVGSTSPFDIYICSTDGTWADSGNDYNGGEVNLSEYAKKTSVDSLASTVSNEASRLRTDEAWLQRVDNDNMANGRQITTLGSQLTDMKTVDDRQDSDIEGIKEDLRNLNPVVIDGNVTNNPDNVFLTSANDEITPKTRTTSLSKKGFYAIRPTDNFASVLSAHGSNYIYQICFDFNLGGATIAVPSGATFLFDGGSLADGVLQVDDIVFRGDVKLHGITFDGTLSQSLDVTWFGAVGDGVKDNSSAIADCIAACESCLADMYVPQGTFRTLLPLTASGKFGIIMDGDLLFAGGVEATALTIGERGENATSEPKKFVLSVVNQTLPSSLNVGNYGIYMINLRNANIFIRRCDQFVNNVTFCASGSGFVYNRIELGAIIDGYRLVTLTTEAVNGANGWCNENLFVGGKLATTSSAAIFHGSGIGVTITSTCNYRSNSNLFFKTCVEGLAIGFDFAYANLNVVLGARFEACTNNIRVLNKSLENSVYGNYMKGQGISGTDILDGNGAFAVPSMSLFDVAKIISTPHLALDTGVIGWAKDASGNVALENITLIHTSALTPQKKYFDKINVDSGIPTFTAGNYAIMYDIDITNAKCFRIAIDGNARVGFIIYDANDTVMENPSFVCSRGVQFLTSYNVHRWQLTSDVSNEAFFVRCDEANAKRIRMTVFRGSNDAAVNSIKIYSDKPCAVTHEGGGLQLPAIPVASRGVQLVGNSAYTANHSPAWVLANNTWVALPNV